MILKTKDLNKIYKHADESVVALENINIEIPAGSFVTVTGPSGSGKTTMLLALSGLIKPSNGQILFEDNRIDDSSDKELALFRRDHIGFVMQNFALIPYLTACQNVMIPLVHKKMSAAEKKQTAMDLLALVGLTNRANHLPRELSSGQQQRVAIARAIVNNPSIVFADEPTGNLDPALSKEILDLLLQINKEKGITIMMVTHSPMAAEYGTLRINLQDGKVITTEE